MQTCTRCRLFLSFISTIPPFTQDSVDLSSAASNEVEDGDLREKKEHPEDEAIRLPLSMQPPLEKKASQTSVASITEPDPSPQKGDNIMVMPEAWLILALQQKNTLMLRKHAVPTGPVWLGHDGLIYGRATVHSCTTLSKERFLATRTEHHHLSDEPPWNPTFAIDLQDIQQLSSNVSFYRPPVISNWVRFKAHRDDVIPRGAGKKKKSNSHKLNQKGLFDEAEDAHDIPLDEITIPLTPAKRTTPVEE